MRVKLTQGELKRQRDALRQYERYLPTLQLKKQQMQLEILHQQRSLREREQTLAGKKAAAEGWSGLIAEVPGIRRWLVAEKVITARKNIAGVDMPVFERAEFAPAEYDLFLTPPWVDIGVDLLRDIVVLQEDIRVMNEGISVLRQELRITTQRVNLFEKVKIPEAKDAIRRIRIALSDQMVSAVGRSKIAKNRIEEADRMEAAA